MISIDVPCLNEELVIGEVVDWCRQGLAELGRTEGRNLRHIEWFDFARGL